MHLAMSRYVTTLLQLSIVLLYKYRSPRYYTHNVLNSNIAVISSSLTEKKYSDMEYTNFRRVIMDLAECESLDIADQASDSNDSSSSVIHYQTFSSSTREPAVNVDDRFRTLGIPVADFPLMIETRPVPLEVVERLEAVYSLEGFPDDALLWDLSDELELGIITLREWFRKRHCDSW